MLPFERNNYIHPEGDKDNIGYDDLLCWFVQGEEQRVLKEKGMPDYLKLEEEHILLLE